MHHQGMQMSEMESEDMSMGLSGREMESNAGPHSDQPDFLKSVFISGGLAKRLTDDFITQPIEPCSHCMMHSQSANSPLQSVALNASSFEGTVADLSVMVLIAPPSLLSFVEVHDNGPPSSTVPRYVLVGTFRI